MIFLSQSSHFLPVAAFGSSLQFYSTLEEPLLWIPPDYQYQLADSYSLDIHAPITFLLSETLTPAKQRPLLRYLSLGSLKPLLQVSKRLVIPASAFSKPKGAGASKRCFISGTLMFSFCLFSALVYSYNSSYQVSKNNRYGFCLLGEP